jgi:hypothetical protein
MEELENVEGFIAVRLEKLPGELSGSVLVDYLDSCKMFFGENLSEDNVVRLTVKLFNQTVLSTSERLQRRLQTLKAVDTVLLVSGIASTDELNSPAFEESLPGIVNKNATGFVDTIQLSDSSDFFANVKTVEAFDPNSPPPTTTPSNAPVSSATSDTLETPAIIAISVATAFVICFAIGAFVYYKKNPSAASGQPTTTTNNQGGPLSLSVDAVVAEVQTSEINTPAEVETGARRNQYADQHDVGAPLNRPRYKDQARTVVEPHALMVNESCAEEVPVVSAKLAEDTQNEVEDVKPRHRSDP